MERGISFINWSVVRIPREWGGMGVTNLYLVNIELLMRWWWKGYAEKNCLWSSTIHIIRNRVALENGPNIWMISGSVFWKQLISIQNIFFCCTTWQIGDGASISFWYDAWSGEAKMLATSRRMHNSFIALKDAWPSRDTLYPNLCSTQTVDFNAQSDTLIWRWENSGRYTAKSAYRMFSGNGMIKWEFNFTWKCRVPPTVRIFAFLLLQDRILTKDVLERRE